MAEIVLIVAVVFEAAVIVRMKKYINSINNLSEENEMLHKQVGQLKFLLDTEQEKNDKMEALVVRLKKEKATMEKRIADIPAILKRTLNS